MMAINHIVTSVRAQNNGNVVSVKIGCSLMAIFLPPPLAFDIDFAHPRRHLRGDQIPYCDGLRKFMVNPIHDERPNS
jgi:hypothetical protein